MIYLHHNGLTNMTISLAEKDLAKRMEKELEKQSKELASLRRFLDEKYDQLENDPQSVSYDDVIDVLDETVERVEDLTDSEKKFKKKFKSKFF
jgi:aspartyl/asparaginyl-tRNA synthetase